MTYSLSDILSYRWTDAKNPVQKKILNIAVEDL